MMKYCKVPALVLLLVCHLVFASATVAQAKKKAVISYYAGNVNLLDSFDANSMTHIIYCFGHLDGSRLKVNDAEDSVLIQKMVAMKKKNPEIKVLLSLGGWGGCETCSDIFRTATGRKEFAKSVKQLNEYFHADGIDLDWEYPTIAGYPGHRYSPDDKHAFTALVKQLRITLGRKQIITFAAGGFQKYLEESVDWKAVMPFVDYVNLMTYDLVSGFSTVTGHHTPLYSTPEQKESTDNCVRYLVSIGVDPRKLIIGAAFYARTWEGIEKKNNGLYQTGKFQHFIDYKHFNSRLSADSGFVFHWDDSAQAPYAYNPAKKIFATFDDKRSIKAKTEYVLKHNLGGIMFWQLGGDTPRRGLLDVINEVLK
jgi:chitinase